MSNKILDQRARAFDHLFDAVVVTDVQGIIIDWNSGSEELYGYSKEEAIGQPVSVLHVPEDVDKTTAEVLDAVGKHGKWTGVVRMLRKDGSIGWVESMVVPLLDDEGVMTGALGINRDISERILNEERLVRMAHYDQLTELPNRALLIDRLEQVMLHAQRNNSRFALLYIDLDNFKAVNDDAGHAVGDLVLKETAKRLKQAVRASDTVARIGGDEFVVLLEELHTEDAVAQVAEQIVDGLRQPCSVKGYAAKLTGSIGIAIYPDDGKTSDELLSSSDNFMYKAKKSGKDKFSFSN